ncbi:MAG: sodium:solute symporter family protein [Pseudomonadota bacterium]
MGLSFIDWAIIAGYLIFTVIVGLAVRRSASKGMESFFVGNRSFPWWIIGISMVATTFAADTPLAVTGIIAREGIAGNWFWWSLALSHLLVVFFLARLWRRTEVITDAEVVELRYDGRGATSLRAFKAFFFAVVINCITLGWVMRAAGKIVASFFSWELLLGAGALESLENLWPAGLAIGTADEALSILALSLVALFYAALGGLRSVILTDLVQFLMALIGAVVFAVFAVNHVGGLDAMVGHIHALYPDRAEDFLRFLPNGVLVPVSAFVLFVTVQWWATHQSDGGGYLAQRTLSARDDKHAYRGMLLFTFLHYAVRTWPWILVGLAALVIYPIGASPEGFLDPDAAARVLGDREAAYPVLMVRLLPPGVLGLLVASLIAAFMSTVDTHINWGASYMVNDVYKRFVRPDASEARLVLVGRLAVAGMLLLALLVSTQVDSVKGAWEFFTLLGAGLGLPHILRWLWWRINAWTELSGLFAAALTTLVLYVAMPQMEYAHKLAVVVGVSAAISLVVTFLTPPVARAHLAAFALKVRPPGRWPEGLASPGAGAQFRRLLGNWALGVFGLFGSLFGTGMLLLGPRLAGGLVLGTALIAFVVAARLGERASE